jgi:Ca-activated chloride channel family protein
MSFEHPLVLWALLALPLLAWLEWRAAVRARLALRAMLGPQPLPVLSSQPRRGARRDAALLRMGALLLLVIGAAGPQWGRESVRRESRGSDLVLVLDCSASMEARDVAPTRMDVARREAIALIERVGETRLGVVAFAGDAVRLCPLTLDPAAVRLTLETIGPGSVSEPGSDLGRALTAALRLLPTGRREEQAVVVWTDGEDLEGGARAALETLRREGLRVFVVGVGTPAGAPIPVLDEAGRTVDTKRDENGTPVVSRLDERLLRDLARRTRGAYFASTGGGGSLPRLLAALGSLSQARHGTRLVERPVARFPWFGLLAVVALAVLALLSRRAAPSAARTAAAMLLAVTCITPARAQSDWARGDAAFRRGQAARAESLYVERLRTGRPVRALEADLQAARASRMGAAIGDSTLESLARLSEQDDAAGRMSGYNHGTALAVAGRVDEAIAALRRTLQRDPNDEDARWNLELLLREKRRREQAASGARPEPQPGESGPAQPQPSAPGQGPAPTPTPTPSPGSPRPSPAGQAPPASAGASGRMTREQAEQLLGALRELERLERQGATRGAARVVRNGRDW